MTIRETGYHDGKLEHQRRNVMVTSVGTDRIEFDDITGWSYGWPSFGAHHSMGRSTFESVFTHEIEFVEVG